MPVQIDRPSDALVNDVEFFRIDANRRVDAKVRSELGQFMTPPAVAELMASMLACRDPNVRLLDPGAGVGSLVAAAVESLLKRVRRPARIEVISFELDPLFIPFLQRTFDLCHQHCEAFGVHFEGRMIVGDFIAWASDNLKGNGLYGHTPPMFNAVITNLDLPAGRPLEEDVCTHCNKCIKACPSGALDGEGWKNVYRCAAYGCCGTCLAICPVGR